MRKLLVVSLAIFTLGACNDAPNPYQAEIEKIDEMVFVTDSLIEVTSSIDSSQIKEEFALVDSAFKVLTGEGAPVDDKEYWTQSLAALQYVHRPYMKYLRDVPKLHKDLSYSKTQLLSLKNSLVDLKLDSAAVNEYMKVEEKALYNNFLMVTKRIGPTKMAMGVWDTAADRYLQMLAKSDSLLQ